MSVAADVLDRPIFVIGMPRSGTTVLFEALARHPELGWLSNYCRMYPRAPWVNGLRRLLDNGVVRLHGHKKQYGSASLLNLWLPQPDEAYEFWDAHTGVPFSRAALHGEVCDPDTSAALRAAAERVVVCQGRHRFSAKMTGPARIQFLRSIFPNTVFIHVIRDGRAVVHSLLHVPFWRNKGGLEQPFWSGLLSSADIELWERSMRDPAVLAGLQWKCVIELTRAEATDTDGQYVEVRYEDFVTAPHEVISSVLQICNLPETDAVHDNIETGPALRNMNDKFRRDLSPTALQQISSSMEPLLGALGYA
jgi:hypothetical protein